MDAKVVRSTDTDTTQKDWGSIQWLVSSDNAASDSLSLGRITIAPGGSLPAHQHPNCEEVFYVLSGQVEHSLPQGGSVTLNAGDSIVLPAGGAHEATNCGDVEAVAIAVFDSADRETA